MPSHRVYPLSEANPDDTFHDIHIDSDTTLLDVRHFLFSLTDIPPDNLNLHLNNKTYPPNSLTDATTLLSTLSFNSSTSFKYSRVSTVSGQVDEDAVANAFRMLKLVRKPTSSKVEPFRARVQHYWNGVCKLEEPSLIEKARGVIPIDKLEKRINDENVDGKSQEWMTLKVLMNWFKSDFFEWVNQPQCWNCGARDSMTGKSAIQPTEYETRRGASRVEGYVCNACGSMVRFPRYENAGTLLETRKGRCGEWARAFALCCRAMGLITRMVYDWTDHVWVECWIQTENRWVHADSCEDVMDEPLMYDRGWGKKLTYCVAVGKDVVMEVTRRYVDNWQQCLERRNEATEHDIDTLVMQMDTNARQIWADRDTEIRWKKDFQDLGRRSEGGWVGGRTSGAKDWIQSRGEDGSNSK